MATATKSGKGRKNKPVAPPVEEIEEGQIEGGEEVNFDDTLAELLDCAASTDCSSTGRFKPPVGEYDLAITSFSFEPKKNQYGPYIEARVGYKILDPEEYADQEFTLVYFLNKTKENELSYDGRNLVQLAGVIVGEPIPDNNLKSVISVLQQCGDDPGSVVISAKIFHRKKNDRFGVEPQALQSGEVTLT